MKPSKEMWNGVMESQVPNPKVILDSVEYSTDLGLAMATDAKQIMQGSLTEEQFYERYKEAVEAEFGVQFQPLAKSPKPQNDPKSRAFGGKKWAMVIDLAKCVGCDTCTVSCKAENRTPPGVSYNVVIEQTTGTFPNVKNTNLPRPCMQCDKAPCVQVCPVRASYKLDNGIVAIDYDRCIGCRYCEVACPYGARSFDFGLSYDQEMEGYSEIQGADYGVNRGSRKPGKVPIGTVRKCTFCMHRLERGEEPACVETCIGDARYFGDLSDPNSEVSKLAASPRAFRLREELGTDPRVIYLL
ncbi:4Fe-4S ferredoxin N-terminal domain-containing protein [Alicyclobacillus sp. ALC3]|uniref:4Fe-4S ferredoxin N-terminal domain-containing protein n=1 Tax=Alicyclobacillus sp. ALC3 TaxID=2796143 RepID=UPI0023797B82|nr:4Fe-4S ferredoxin N-terminal domain-containing protein [Alicyclobacillus sp. ALC3]